jgi:hypothetical protein
VGRWSGVPKSLPCLSPLLGRGGGAARGAILIKVAQITLVYINHTNLLRTASLLEKERINQITFLLLNN